MPYKPTGNRPGAPPRPRKRSPSAGPTSPESVRGGSHSLSRRGLVGVSLAVLPEERELLHEAARLAGLPLAHWLRQVAVEAARKVFVENLPEKV